MTEFRKHLGECYWYSFSKQILGYSMLTVDHVPRHLQPSIIDHKYVNPWMAGVPGFARNVMAGFDMM